MPSKGPQFLRVQSGNIGRRAVLQMENDLALGGIECSQDRAACGCLAGATLPHQSQRFSLKDVQVDAIHSLYRPGPAPQETMPQREIFFEVFHFEQYAALFIKHW